VKARDEEGVGEEGKGGRGDLWRGKGGARGFRGGKWRVCGDGGDARRGGVGFVGKRTGPALHDRCCLRAGPSVQAVRLGCQYG
jgi:hypothetical protein